MKNIRGSQFGALKIKCAQMLIQDAKAQRIHYIKNMQDAKTRVDNQMQRGNTGGIQDVGQLQRTGNEGDAGLHKGREGGRASVLRNDGTIASRVTSKIAEDAKNNTIPVVQQREGERGSYAGVSDRTGAAADESVDRAGNAQERGLRPGTEGVQGEVAPEVHKAITESGLHPDEQNAIRRSVGKSLYTNAAAGARRIVLHGADLIPKIIFDFRTLVQLL